MESRSMQAILIGLGGFCFPGLGHLILGKWVRSLLFAFPILLLFGLGLSLGGKLHTLAAEQFIEFVFLFADLGIGLLYFLAKFWGYGAGNLENQSFDYGTTYLAVAGLLNLLAALNAYDIAVGRKR